MQASFPVHRLVLWRVRGRGFLLDACTRRAACPPRVDGAKWQGSAYDWSVTVARARSLDVKAEDGALEFAQSVIALARRAAAAGGRGSAYRAKVEAARQIGTANHYIATAPNLGGENDCCVAAAAA